MSGAKWPFPSRQGVQDKKYHKNNGFLKVQAAQAAKAAQAAGRPQKIKKSRRPKHCHFYVTSIHWNAFFGPDQPGGLPEGSLGASGASRRRLRIPQEAQPRENACPLHRTVHFPQENACPGRIRMLQDAQDPAFSLGKRMPAAQDPAFSLGTCMPEVDF